MNRRQYMAARALLRANGRAALRWMPPQHAGVMARVEALRKVRDPLADLARDRRDLRGLVGRLWLEWRRAAWLEVPDQLPAPDLAAQEARAARTPPAVVLVRYLETRPGWAASPAGC